jgi:hypothetical protein
MFARAVILAEVGDKEPDAFSLWVLALCLSIAAILLCRWRRIALVGVVPICVAWWFVATGGIRDPQLAPLLSDELGGGYFAQAQIAAVLPLVFAVIGTFVASKRRRPLVAA